MAEELLNGREPLDWEVAAVERGRRDERSRGLDLLAGVLSGDPPRVLARVPRPTADLVLEFSGPRGVGS